ncbi:MAG TPA: hypothetical protein VF789_06520 [Thermoanaerobaculia bacterium]
MKIQMKLQQPVRSAPPAKRSWLIGGALLLALVLFLVARSCGEG